MKFSRALLVALLLFVVDAAGAVISPVDGVIRLFRAGAPNDSYLFLAVAPGGMRFVTRFEFFVEEGVVVCRRDVFSDEGVFDGEKLVGQHADRVVKLLRGFDWNVRPRTSTSPYAPTGHAAPARLTLMHRHEGIYREIESVGNAVPELVAILDVVTSKQ